MSKLTLDDIADIRAYEREREAFRRHVIELKKVRRVYVGPVAFLVFENRDTIRFQIQEMARVERIYSDEGIQTELDIYNPLVPETGRVSATLFLGLADDAALREWLPRLVGIERSIVLRLGPDGGTVVRFTPDAEHEQQLTREDVTAAVHYVHLHLTPEQVDLLEAGPAWLGFDHPEYRHEIELETGTRASLVTDFRS